MISDCFVHGEIVHDQLCNFRVHVRGQLAAIKLGLCAWHSSSTERIMG